MQIMLNKYICDSRVCGFFLFLGIQGTILMEYLVMFGVLGEAFYAIVCQGTHTLEHLEVFQDTPGNLPLEYQIST